MLERSAHPSFSGRPEAIAHDTQNLGLGEDALIVGSSALRMAFKRKARRPHDLDIATSEEGFNYLWRQPGWEKTHGPEGQPLLRREHIEVGIGWGNISFETLKDHSFPALNVVCAGLHIVYGWMQQHDRPKNQADLARIKENLINGTVLKDKKSKLFQRELAIVMSHMPEDEEFDGESRLILDVAAYELGLVRTLYGDRKGPTGVHTYFGRVETKGVTPYYHEVNHSLGLLKRDQRYISHVNRLRPHRYTSRDRAVGAAATLGHDGFLGNAREEHCKDFDEKVSSEMVARHLLLRGCSKGTAEESRAGIRGTGWNEKYKQQDIRAERGHLDTQQRIARADLGETDHAGAAEEAGYLAPEDAQRLAVADKFERAIGERRDEINEARLQQGQPRLWFPFPEDIFRLADQDPTERSRKMIVKHLLGSVSFLPNVKIAGNNPFYNIGLRQAHAAFLRKEATRIENDGAAVEFIANAQAHTAKMQAHLAHN